MPPMEDADTPPESVAGLLRTFRGRAGLSQAQLARLAGVSDGMIGNVERGTRNIGTANAERIAEVLQLSAEERELLKAARDRYAVEESTLRRYPPADDGDDWNEYKSSLSPEDRAAVRAIIESLRTKPRT